MKREGAICLTSIDYRHIMKAHTGQATTINKLKSDNNKLKSNNDQLRADFAALNRRFKDSNYNIEVLDDPPNTSNPDQAEDGQGKKVLVDSQEDLGESTIIPCEQ